MGKHLACSTTAMLCALVPAMRYGHQMPNDLPKKANPGDSATGRLNGLAELHGLEMSISRSIG
jgi:D-mannonate dehydratase